MAADTSSSAATAREVVGAEAVVWAWFSDEPMLATSDAAAANPSCAAITNDIATPPRLC